MCRNLTLSVVLILVLGLILTSPALSELVGWWRMDEGSGAVAYDASGYGRDGAFNGDPEWVTGYFGGALEFDGDDYLDTGYTENLTNWTIAAWVRSPAAPSSDSPSGPVHREQNYQFNWNHGDATYRGAAAINVGGTWYAAKYEPLEADTWYYLTATYDGEDLKAYRDGVLITTNSNPSGPPSSEGNSLKIARHAAATQYFTGIVDDVRVYDEALTDAEILGIMAGGGGYPYALNPSPADGATHLDTWITLSWQAGDSAVSHDVYLGNNFDDVNDATNDSEAFHGNQGSTFFVAGFPGFAYPDGLIPGTTYFWRVDEVNDADPNSPWKGPIWSFFIPPRKAYNPTPSDGAMFVETDVTLSWTGGLASKLHSVYFGDNFDDVNDAVGGIPQALVTYSPGALEMDKEYFWRVDEFDGALTHKGDVWSFTTLPDIPISDPDLLGWWKLDEGMGTVALDWSGHGRHGTFQGDPQWVAGYDGGAVDFDGDDHIDTGYTENLATYTIACWVMSPEAPSGDAPSGPLHREQNYQFNWNHSNDIYRGAAAMYVGGIWHAASYMPLNANQWYHLAATYDGNVFNAYRDGALITSNSAPSGAPAAEGNSLKLGRHAAAVQYYTGIVDDARVYNRALSVEEIQKAMRGDPFVAWNPNPSNGSTPNINDALPLSWSAGDNATQHDVYFGVDAGGVEDADASNTTGIYRGRQSATTYRPPEGVEWGGGPYYWRIDEVTIDGTITKGRIWNFTVADFVLVDGFESYTDDDLAGEAIWQHWIDGFGVADNGSQVGYLLPPYAERTIVHSGAQSMPLLYNNVGGVTNSEATLTLTAPRNWTDQEVAELSLWFRGLPASTGSFVEAPAGTFTMTGSGEDIWNLGTAGDYHDEFHYAYKTLSGAGSITARVVSVENTNGWAKAGVMIRETLDGGSRHAFACVTPSNGVASQGRLETGGDSFNANQTGMTAPYWVRLTRDLAGNFTVAHSANGTTWEAVASATPQNIQMGLNVYVGLAVTAHNANATCEAVFSNVTITGNVSGQWANQDIGLASNAAEPLYIAVANPSGAPAIVAHDDPAAANIEDWTEWRIPLQTFADQGINLTNVDTMALGLGTGSGMTGPGGSGTMYFDDIRLYRSAPEPEPQP